MSSRRTITPRRPSLSIPCNSSSLQTVNKDPEDVELIDMAATSHGDPSIYTLACTHQPPQPPSPLVTFAPTPPLSPINLTPLISSLHSDLSTTLKPLPAYPTPPPPPPIPAPRYIDYPLVDPTGRITRYRDLEAGRYLDDEDEDPDVCMPAGYPYRGWRGYALLALEWLKNMSALLSGLMEQEHRWGGARHTI
ncbi:MAG: hypothetical protein Q9166_000233 [cf. Caloplaca sp. 2 TL-2023]